MKKIFFFAAAVVAMAACQKGPQPLSDEFKTPVEEGAPQAVLFSSNVNSVVESKAQGSVDAWDGTQNLYVYGYQRIGQAIDYSTAEPFMPNVVATSPTSGTEGKLELLNEAGNPFYYAGNNTYDFYGYYVDGLNYDAEGTLVEPTKTPEGLYLPVTITGGEDIMLAKANPEVDGAELVNSRFAYSAWAARRNVHPTLKFEHQLVQFKFEIASGSDDAEAQELKVTGLTLDALTEGKLYVAGSTLGFKDVDLTKKSAVSLYGFEEYTVPNMEEGVDSAEKIGDCIMVIPNTVNGPLAAADVFTGKVQLTQKGAPEGAFVDFSLNFDEDVKGAPEGLTAFAAGYSFTVKITVYSLKEVEVTAVLTPWENGGNVIIDTDKQPEIVD